MSAQGSKAWRCHNCKTIVFEDEEPKRCPACRWCSQFSPCGVVSAPRLGTEGRR